MSHFPLPIVLSVLVTALGSACGDSTSLNGSAAIPVKSMLMIDRNPVSPLEDVLVLLSSEDLSSSCAGTIDGGILPSGMQAVQLFLSAPDLQAPLAAGVDLPFSPDGVPTSLTFDVFVVRQDAQMPYSTSGLSYGEGESEVQQGASGSAHISSVSPQRVTGRFDAFVLNTTSGARTELSGAFDAPLCVSVP